MYKAKLIAAGVNGSFSKWVLNLYVVVIHAVFATVIEILKSAKAPIELITFSEADAEMEVTYVLTLL